MGKETASKEDTLQNKTNVSKKGFLRKLLTLALCLFIACGVSIFFFINELKSMNDYVVPKMLTPYELKSGMSAYEVIVDLTQNDYPDYMAYAFLKFYKGEFDNIQKGPYLIDGTKTLKEILEDMKNGAIYEVEPLRALIVEGLSLPLMLNALNKSEDLEDDSAECLKDPKKFIQAGLDDAFSLSNKKGEIDFKKTKRLYPESVNSLEGLFLPATYPYYKGDGACKVLRSSFIKMAQTLQAEWENRDTSIPLQNPYEALILASIVERESSIDKERPLIAKVFYNRLEKSMRLQTDPTVMYGVAPDFRGSLKLSQLRKDTPYNTYTRDGLPPTPIAMPGLSSILAVLHPEDTKAFYFVAKSHDPKDGHVFSNTLKEHQQAVRDYRKKVREYRRAQK